MQHHYSTVNAKEQREGIARVIDLFNRTESGTPEASGTKGGATQRGGGAKTKKAG